MIDFNTLWDKYPRRAPSKGNKRKAEAHFRRALKNGATAEHIAEQLDKHIQSELAVGNCQKNGKGYVANQYMMQAETFFSTGWEREFVVDPEAEPLTQDQEAAMRARGYRRNAAGLWEPMR